MNRQITALATSLVVVLILPITGHANGADCASKACITVRTDPARSGIVITAVQISPGKTTSPKPSHVATKRTAVHTHRPVIHRTPTPRSTTHAVPQRLRTQSSSAPRRTRKPQVVATPTPSVVAAVSLSDTLTQLLPGRGIYYQPSNTPIAGLPVTFASDAPDIFSTLTSILGITVGVSLHPEFQWDFGDGAPILHASQTTIFPNPGVIHTYLRPGNYSVTLTISWSGSWSAGGFNYPVLGEAIVQKIRTVIPVKAAPTRYFR